MNFKHLIITVIICIFVSFHSFSRSLEPNKRMIDTIVSVIDSIPAYESFLLIKPDILNQIEELRNEQNVLQALLQSKRNKAKTDYEKQIVSNAFEFARLNNTRYYKYKWSGELEKDLKDVNKGKLSESVRYFLSYYDTNYLSEEISQLTYSLEHNWTKFLDNPPTKKVSIKIENPNYRGLHYDNYYRLNDIEESRLLGEYDFLLTEDGEKVKESYPIELSYLKFDKLPEYKVVDLTWENHFFQIFDSNGRLNYIPIIQRQSDNMLYPGFISEEIERQVYHQDYLNNKYGILKENSKTQLFLYLWIGRDKGMQLSTLDLDPYSTEYGYNLIGEHKRKVNPESYKDNIGERFLKQIKSDHKADFGYLYLVERLSPTKFFVIYLNENTLRPSVCATVSFSTGCKPYTATFTVKLCKAPNNIPEVIRHHNRY